MADFSAENFFCPAFSVLHKTAHLRLAQGVVRVRWDYRTAHSLVDSLVQPKIRPCFFWNFFGRDPYQKYDVNKKILIIMRFVLRNLFSNSGNLSKKDLFRKMFSYFLEKIFAKCLTGTRSQHLVDNFFQKVWKHFSRKKTFRKSYQKWVNFIKIKIVQDTNFTKKMKIRVFSYVWK